MNAQNHSYGATLSPLHRRARGGSFLNRLFALENLWRSRRSLSQLDSARLDDLGLSHKDAAKEAKRPVWDAPARWFQ